MSWSGNVHFGDDYFIFRGGSADNKMHKHASLQLTFGLECDVSFAYPPSELFSGQRLYVKPGEMHALEPSGRVLLILVEPQSSIARNIMFQLSPDPIGILQESILRDVDIGGDLLKIAESLEKSVRGDSEEVDLRLTRALDYLRKAPLKGAIAAAADHAHLSESHLREIANRELGVPLSKWLVWNAVKRSSKSILLGQNLTDAALEGGFADQAHFTRTARSLMGLTPAEIRNALTV